MSTPPARADESPAPQSPDENPVTGEQPVTAAPAQAPAAPVVVAQIPGHGPVYAQYPQAPPPVEPHPGPYPGQYPYYPGQPPHQGRPPHPGPHGHAPSGFGAPPPPRPADRGGVVAVVGFVLVLVLGMLAVAVSADRGSERRARDEQPITFTLPPVQAITPPPIIATEPPTGRVQAQIGARMSPECDLADALLERAKTRNRAEGRSDSYFANCDYRTLADADTGYRELQVTVGAFDYPDIRNDWFDEEYGRRWDEVRELPGVGERAKVMLRPTDRSGDMVTIKVVSGVRIYEVVYGGTVRDSYLADPIPAAEAEAIAMEVLQAVMAR
ncbi:hypothetical protein [Actinosynnema mirum]|uniref:Uncharacterized protein n=1 Tax=Actinosynnema mirum (strain ATCC 29888 / DSM 43827 / JCM 3225 / NBRC 14064 / NCIMB 13271 / NRRL B-12336 / IMRU 3971 / 101) TaxID=446462 RepID=C6W8H4_ACTMD|nr:hypothetical protein [Actinosynnema mirum]ACU39021.1 hypothetical protein Amir_5200 [Actinosynnema mirum DSM 43827]